MNQATTQHKNPRQALAQIRRLLDRGELLRDMAGRADGDRNALLQDLTERQQDAALAREINQLHPADIAFVLEQLPQEERQRVWDLVDTRFDGSVLLEVSDAVRDTLIQQMDAEEIVGAAAHLDSDELAELVPDLPGQLLPEILESMGREEQEQLRAILSYPDDSVGALMDVDFVAVREDVSLDVVLRYLRAHRDLPDTLQELPVVDRGGRFRGNLRIQTLLRTPGEVEVRDVMDRDVIFFHTNDLVDDAVHAFERYDLVSTPVVNNHGVLVGVLAIDEILDHLQDASQSDLLSQAGLRQEEDLYAPAWRSARHRGLWLALNLVTAFVASRIIGAFEATIEQLVALAALMPIVAAVGGNGGNQTLALVIRSFALNQIDSDTFRHLVSKEATVGLIGGLLCGGAMGLVVLAFYGDLVLALVMFVSMAMTLALAGVAGVLTPALLRRAGFDPAYGSAVIVTGITDSLGFLIFLGLASMALAL
jgi:magnesium transporter